MSIAYDFFKEESPFAHLPIQERIIFFIENYTDFLEFYRVMTLQLEETKKKKEQAHQRLTNLRDRIEHLDKKQISLTESEKLDLDNKVLYYENIREEDDIVYYRGLPMDLNQATISIVKYQSLFELLEKIDRRCRMRGSKSLSVAINFITWPISKITQLFMYNTKSKLTTDLCKKIHKICYDLPEITESSIIEQMDVNLSDHLPPENESDQ